MWLTPPRPIVARYRAFKDALRAELRHKGVTVPDDVLIVSFGVMMAASWSQKKKDRMVGSFHRQTPDVDNLLKALMDAAHIEDKSIHTVFAEKVWAYEGFIRIITYPS